MENGERRNNYVDIETKLGRLDERLEGFMNHTTEYRRSLSGKLDHVLLRMSDLPCKTHDEKMRGMGRRINWIWAVIVIVLAAIAREWVKGGH